MLLQLRARRKHRKALRDQVSLVAADKAMAAFVCEPLDHREQRRHRLRRAPRPYGDVGDLVRSSPAFLSRFRPSQRVPGREVERELTFGPDAEGSLGMPIFGGEPVDWPAASSVPSSTKGVPQDE